MATIEFDQTAVSEAENAFKKVEMAPEQKGIVDGIAKVLCNFVPISELGMKGFISFVFRDYQIQEKTLVSGISTMTPTDRVKTVGKLFDMLIERLKPVLKNKTDEAQITEAVHKAFTYYKENFANR
jgi:hypothetical protein